MIDKNNIESNLKNPSNYIMFWKEIVIILLLIVCVFIYWRFNEKNKDLEAQIARHKAEQTAGKINEGTSSVTEREEKVYPKIDADIATLNKIIKDDTIKLQKLEKSKPTKDKSYAKFKNQSASSISKYLASRGFTNAVYNRISGR